MVEKGNLPALKIINQWRFKKDYTKKWLKEYENEYMDRKYRR